MKDEVTHMSVKHRMRVSSVPATDDSSPKTEVLKAGAQTSMKRGRPTIEESSGDPSIGQKARDLREAGFSWTQIADTLKIGRSTARRLCQKSELEQGGEVTRQEASDFRHGLSEKKRTSGEA